MVIREGKRAEQIRALIESTRISRFLVLAAGASSGGAGPLGHRYRGAGLRAPSRADHHRAATITEEQLDAIA
jgi:hypothetical protein